jgi:HK97 family phage major capsid protein
MEMNKMNSNIITTTKEDLQKVVETKANELAQEKLRGMNPTNVPQSGFVKVKAEHDAKRDQARIVADYITAITKGKIGVAEDIANRANERYITRADFNTGTNSQGGFAVPQFWVEDIMSFADRFGYARALAKIYPMRGKIENITSSGAFSAAVVAEGSSLTLTDSTSFYTGTALTAKKIVGGCIVTDEQLRDATPAFLDYTIQGLAQAVAEAEDKQFFKGTGNAPEFTGCLVLSGTSVIRQGGANNSGKDTFAEISWKDLINLRLGVNSSVGANGVFVVPQSVFGHLLKETDGVNGRPIWDMIRPMEVNSIGLTALENNTYVTPTGRPMHVVPDSLFPSSAANTASAVYADFSQYSILGIREDVAVDEYKEYFASTGLGGTSQRGIMVSESIGIAFPAPSAIGVLKTSTT